MKLGKLIEKIYRNTKNLPHLLQEKTSKIEKTLLKYNKLSSRKILENWEKRSTKLRNSVTLLENIHKNHTYNINAFCKKSLKTQKKLKNIQKI